MAGPLAFLGPIAGLGSSLFNMGQQRQANNINWRAVMETIRANRKREELERSTRGDAYGNKIVYTPGVGFEYQLTPTTKGVLDAEQRERLANLTKDAPRNRAAAERMDARSKAAGDEYTREFNKYKYRTEPSEEEYVADTRQTLLNSRKRGLDEAANLLAKQLLRTGSSSNIGRVYKDAADEYAKSLEDVNLNAKRLGGQQFRSDRDSDEANFAGRLNMLRGTADQTTTSPVNFSGFNEQLSGRADNALSSLSNALSEGSDATRKALAQYAQGVGNTQLDLSGLAQMLASLGRGNNEEEESFTADLPSYDRTLF